jgi:hypothetical protein
VRDAASVESGSRSRNHEKAVQARRGVRGCCEDARMQAGAQHAQRPASASPEERPAKAGRLRPSRPHVPRGSIGAEQGRRRPV